MMISFLAALEDGVSYDANVHTRTDKQTKATREGTAGLKLPSVLAVLPFDLRGRLAGEDTAGSSEEMNIVRRHTEASLFNKLRNALLDLNAIVSIDIHNTDSWRKLRPGDLAEVSGETRRNPLTEVLTLFSRLMPIVMATQQAPQVQQRQGQAKKQATQKPQETSEFDLGVRMFQWLREDLEAAHTQDILFSLNNTAKTNLILTMSQDFGTGRTLDDLLGAELTVLGKVTRVLTGEQRVNLLRRSAMSYMSDNAALELLQGVANSPGSNLQINTTEVTAPSLQILPMAIFT